MIVDIIMPKMGESINEGTILEWRKEIGDSVQLDEILLEIGTDKVDSEIPSSVAGILIEILAKPNDVVEVGEVIARVSTNKEEINFDKKIQTDSNDILPLQKNESKGKAKELVIKTSGKRKKAFFTPVVMKIASENNIPIDEVASIEGTGRSGRVTKKDILSHLKKSYAEKNINIQSEPLNLKNQRVEEMSHMRKTIASHMVNSISTSAHVHIMTEVDMTLIVEFVYKQNPEFEMSEGYKLTYTPFIIDAVVRSLKEYPIMNSSISGTSVAYHRNVNIGLAVAIDNGLMVPSINNCEEKNFIGLCRSVNHIANKTREGDINSDELKGTTFSITNFGVFGVSMGTPIINQPNVGILGVGAIKKQPVVLETQNGDSIAIRNIMILTLGFDHRLIDGAVGSNFLEKIRYYLENFQLRDIL